MEEMTSPRSTTMPIIPFKDTSQPSTPGAIVFRKFEKYLTVRPEKIRAIFAPRPKRG
jgi:hypothetical protein